MKYRYSSYDNGVVEYLDIEDKGKYVKAYKRNYKNKWFEMRWLVGLTYHNDTINSPWSIFDGVTELSKKEFMMRLLE